MTALGQNDGEISKICKTLSQKIRDFYIYANNPVSFVSAPINAEMYARAMIGHILSATSVTECLKPSNPAPYFDPLKRFVLGDSKALNESHDIYYWFFPHRHHQSIKLFGFRNKGNTCCMSLLSFYPLAFLLTEKGKGIYPAGAQKLDLSDKKITVSLSLHNVHFSTFPAVPLEGDQIAALIDSSSIISFPVK
ncbi:hypothetical protein [Pseudomonas xanthosomatis]|uniref:hypothetical protein n=1 Tax=Pseudomonas xanthosomatis TaxID=2842356 RepID=UPI001CEC563A|nr:hypothetical protein [Pseudomonas xanthosomatis]